MTSKARRLVPAPPIKPGDVLRTRILSVPGLTQDRLAEAMSVSRFSINQIVNGKRAITAEMALRLGYVTSTTPQFWLNLQRDTDIYEAEMNIGDILNSLTIIRDKKSDSELFQDDDG